MRKIIIPAKLTPGDTVAIITPSYAKSRLPKKVLLKAQERLESLGLKVVWAPNTGMGDSDGSSPAGARLADIAWAFQDPKVKAIWCAIGGFNANQLLDGLDWRLVARNPKIFIGHSDITVLLDAVFARTGLVTYYGPNLYSLASGLSEYTLDRLSELLMTEGAAVVPRAKKAAEWKKGWRGEQSRPSPRPAILSPGEAKGIGIGGNAGTFFLLQGTEYMPVFDQDTILFLEDDDLSGKFTLAEFDRKLISIMQQPGARQFVKGLLVGNFQASSPAKVKELKAIIARQPALAGKPVVANLPFGHTEPKCVLPIGGEISLEASAEGIKLTIL